MKWLLDTNVVSEPIQKRPDPNVRAWMGRRSPDQFAISIVTLAELHEGVRRAPTADRQAFLQTWLESDIEHFFRERTLPLTTEVLVDWLILARRLGATGRPQSATDLLIASTARVHDLVVVSRNTRHFVGTGVMLFDPWSGKSHQMESV